MAVFVVSESKQISESINKETIRLSLVKKKKKNSWLSKSLSLILKQQC